MVRFQIVFAYSAGRTKWSNHHLSSISQTLAKAAIEKCWFQSAITLRFCTRSLSSLSHYPTDGSADAIPGLDVLPADVAEKVSSIVKNIAAGKDVQTEDCIKVPEDYELKLPEVHEDEENDEGEEKEENATPAKMAAAVTENAKEEAVEESDKEKAPKRKQVNKDDDDDDNNNDNDHGEQSKKKSKTVAAPKDDESELEKRADEGDLASCTVSVLRGFLKSVNEKVGGKKNVSLTPHSKPTSSF